MLLCWRYTGLMATTEQLTAWLARLEEAKYSGALSVRDADGTSVTYASGKELSARIVALKRELGLIRRPRTVLAQQRR